MALIPYKKFLTGLGLALGLSCAVAQTSGNDSARENELSFSGSISSFDLLLNESQSFDIITLDTNPVDNTCGSLLCYEPSTRFIDINVAGPLTCFELADDGSPEALRLFGLDGNNHTIFEGLRLAGSLEYRLFTNQVALQTSSTSACFYDGNQGFGLNGNVPVEPIDDGDQIFGSRFEGGAELVIEFIDVPQFVRPNESISYKIRIRNVGLVQATNVGFQELYPVGTEFFPDGQLQLHNWGCVASSGAQCPPSPPGLPPSFIRTQDIQLPPGGFVVFDINNRVRSTAPIGGFIELNAAAVVGRDSGAVASWDAESTIMTIIGEGQTIAAEVTNSVAPVANGDDTAEIRVTALDSFKNATPDVLVELSNADGLIIQPASGVTGPDGSVTFSAITSGLAQAGTFQPQFSAPNLGASGVTTQVDVTFVAGSPSQISAQTLVDNVTANGSDAATLAVEILDAWDNPVPATLVEVDNDDGLVFVQNSVATDLAGVALFAASTMVSGTYNPAFSQAEIPASSSSTVTFVPGDPAQLAFLVQPGDTDLGNPISPGVLIEVRDATGNRVVSDNSTEIVVQLRQGPGSGSFIEFLTPPTSVLSGQLQLDDLVMNQEGQNLFLRAAASGIIQADSQLFNVNAPDPN